MDLPAKAAVVNAKQFNGEFGCIYCYHPGEYCRLFNKRIYPPLKVINNSSFIFTILFKFFLQG